MEEWWQLSHLYVTVLLFYFPIYLVNPAITDVTVDALCGGTEECSFAIYLTGVQQAADSVEEKKRVAAFAVLSGVICGANVSANFAAGLLSIPHIFQVATAVSILAALYVRFILNDTARLKDESERLIEAESSQGSSSHTKTDFIHQIPSPKTVLLLLKSSTTFALAASVCFFNSLSESGAASF